MNKEEISDLFLFSKYLAVIVQYHKNNNICFSIVTRNPNYYVENKNKNFYDFILKKQVTIDIDNIVYFYMQFSDLVDYGKIRKETLKLDDAELKKHFEYNIKFADMFNKIKAKEKREISRITKKMSINDLLTECSENLFFTPTASTKEGIVSEMKKRKEFLLQTIDGGIVEKITSIFDIKDEELFSTDKNIINKCKEKWKSCIVKYCDKAKKMLEEERKGEWNSEDLSIEIEEINNMLDITVKEFEEKPFTTPKEIASFWPDILKPAPKYVFK